MPPDQEDTYLLSPSPPPKEEKKETYKEFQPEARKEFQEGRPVPKPAPIVSAKPEPKPYKEYTPESRQAHQAAIAKPIPKPVPKHVSKPAPKPEPIKVLSERGNKTPLTSELLSERRRKILEKPEPKEKQHIPIRASISREPKVQAPAAKSSRLVSPSEARSEGYRTNLNTGELDYKMGMEVEARTGGGRVVAYAPGYEPQPQKPPKPQSRMERIKEIARETGVKAGKKAREYAAKAAESAKQSRIVAGLKVGAQEATEKIEQAAYKGAKEVGKLPYTIPKIAYDAGSERLRMARESVRLNLQQGTKGWATPLIGSIQKDSGYRYGGGRVRQPKPVRMGMPFVRIGGKGRMPRSSIPKGVIKPYWSKKLKKLARQNIRKYGSEEGLARTRQIASLAGWKMQ